MRRALVDNSTITSLQRLHGSIRVFNTDHVNGDISALEQFITALLLFDEVYFVVRPSYRAVFRNLTIDLMEIPRLGALYDKLTSAIRYGENAGTSAWPPRDERKYLRATTHWKQPM